VNNQIHLAIVRNPFDVSKDREFRQFDYLPGASIRNYLQSCLLSVDSQVFYSPRGREGRVLTPEEWDSVIPESGDALVAMPMIAGGHWKENRKTILSIVAQIGLAMTTMGVGNLASTGAWSMSAATMSSWTTWGTLAAVATAYAGGWLLNQWTPGDPVEGTPETTYGWGQITNATGEGNAIPITFGEVRTGGQLLNYYVTYDGDKQYLNLLYSGGEGPCDYDGNGITNPNGPDNVSGISGILINGNPIENYKDIKIYKRAGLNNQSVVKNFQETVVEQALAFELQQSDDWSEASTAITSGNAGQGFMVVLEMPAGCYRSSKNGLANAEVKVNIRYRPYIGETETEQPWLNADQIIVSAKTTTPIYKQLIVDHQDSAGQYEVQCLCTHKSCDDSSSTTHIYWRTLATITYDDFIYPNKIILGIKALATDQISGGMPTVTWIQKRSMGWAWNPYTQTHEEKPLNVPAWAAYDLLCRIKRYLDINTGEWQFVNEGIDKNRIDYPAFAEAAEYQSKPIDGEQFCSCNYYLDQTMTLWEALKSIEEVGRFKILPRGTKYSCVVDQPAEPVQVFTVGNTILDSFGETFVDTVKRANAIEIRFRNKDKDYEWDTAVVTIDDYDNSETVPNPIQITLTACTGWKQAHREGGYRIRQNQLITRTVSHSADIDAIACQVGDVYYLQRDVPTWGTGGRIVDATETTVILDTLVTFEPGKSYSLWFRMANDALIQKQVINPAAGEESIETQTITVSLPFVNDRHVPTWIDSVRFSVPGDQTALYTVGREIEIEYGFGLIKVSTVIASFFENESTIVRIPDVPVNINLVRFDYTMPRENDVYSFGETTIVAKPFRVTSITRDGDLRRKITGIEYVEAAYDELTDVPVPDYTGTSEGITAAANSHVDTAGTPWLDLSWTTPRFYFGARIELDGKGVAQVDNSESSIAIRLDSYGSYQIKVTAMDLFGRDIASTSLSYEVTVNAIIPFDVTNLALSEDTFILRDGTVITDVDVSFSRPETFYKAFNVYYSLDGLNWTLAGQTTNGFYKLKSIRNTGKVFVKVKTVSPFGVESEGAVATVALVGKSQPPGNVTGVQAVQDESNRVNLILTWDAVSPELNPDLKGYEVRVGDSWDGGARTGGLVYGIQTEYLVSNSGNYSFFIKALDNSGNYSTNAATKSITVEVKPNAPTNGKAAQDVRDSTYIILGWSPVPDKDLAVYEIRQGDTWDAGTAVGATKETIYRIKLTSSGRYNFMVRSQNAAGFLSNILNIPLTAGIEPPDVTGFAVAQQASDPSEIRFVWDKPEPLDIAYYEIREGVSWDAGEIVASFIVGLFYDAVINNESPKTFWIKAINVGGIYSQYPAQYVAVFELNPSAPRGLAVRQDPNDKSVLTISWTGIADLDLNEYELRQGARWMDLSIE
jgi:predicted phage tail protein